MAKKDQNEKAERKPDLATPDQDAVEERVKGMLDLKEPEEQTPPAVKKIEVIHHEPEKTDDKADADDDGSLVSSAPELPAEAEATEIESPAETEKPKEAELKKEEVKADETEEKPDVEEAVVAEPLLETEATEKENDQSPVEKTEDADTDKTLDDPKTTEAVDDIVAHESDELLAAEDEKAASASEPTAKNGLGAKIGGFFRAWWNNPKARWGTIVGVILIATATFAVPTSRYYVLNTAGVRAKAKIVVLDESTGQPLKNVQVTLSGSSEKTATDGTVEFEKVKLGTSEVIVSKRAFAEEKQITTIRMGSNNLGEFKLTPVGVQYSFVITDFLSGKPLDNAEAISGEASALSDSDGKIKLTVDEADDNQAFVVIIKLDGYRDEERTLTQETVTEQQVSLVPARKHAFVSKQSGKHDVYSIDADGKNEKMVLAGTGSEQEDISLAVHPTSNVAALVSTRDSQRNKDGYLLSTLTLIDLDTETSAKVTSSERVQLIDWIGDRLIYVQATAGASANDPKRHRLMSYNFKTNTDQELSASNYFNDVLVAKGKIFYAPSSAFQEGNTAQLFRIEADGSGKTTIVNKEVWNIFRSDYDNLAVSAQQDWYNVRLGEDKATSLPSQPANLTSRTYVDSPDSVHSLWTDNRDGKGVLLAYELSTQNELTLRSQAGLRYPVRWLNNKTIVYRVSGNQETADYVINIDGGEPKKIRDVTNTGSVDKWYYY